MSASENETVQNVLEAKWFAPKKGSLSRCQDFGTNDDK